MLIQLMAYECMGQVQVHCVRMEATESGHSWSQLISELVPDVNTPDGDVWDTVWLIGQLLSDRALERNRSSDRY